MRSLLRCADEAPNAGRFTDPRTVVEFSNSMFCL